MVATLTNLKTENLADHISATPEGSNTKSPTQEQTAILNQNDQDASADDEEVII